MYSNQRINVLSLNGKVISNINYISVNFVKYQKALQGHTILLLKLGNAHLTFDAFQQVENIFCTSQCSHDNIHGQCFGAAPWSYKSPVIGADVTCPGKACQRQGQWSRKKTAAEQWSLCPHWCLKSRVSDLSTSCEHLLSIPYMYTANGAHCGNDGKSTIWLTLGLPFNQIYIPFHN